MQIIGVFKYLKYHSMMILASVRLKPAMPPPLVGAIIIRKGIAMEMKRNVGASDRYVRAIIGLGFIMNVFSLDPTRFGMFVLLALGFLILNTAYTGYCFMYDILNINTYEKKTPPAEPTEQAHSH